MPSRDQGWTPRQQGAWLDGAQAAWLQAFRTGAGGPQKTSGPDADDAALPVRWMFAGQIIRDPVILAQDLANIDFPDAGVADRCNRFSLIRGRRPSAGAVLMPKFSFDEIEDPQQCRHTLMIDCRETVTIQRLCVRRVEALCANVTEGVTEGRMETRGLHPNTPMIVELSDARFYAGMSGIRTTFNLRNVTGVLRSQRSYRAVVQAIWQDLQPIFGEELTIDADDPANDLLHPENLEFQGISAWDALWIVLDLAGWSFSLGFDGKPRVFQPKLVAETQSIFETINKGANRATRWDTKGEVLDTALPEKIKACTLQKDYQFYNDPDGQSFHSGDMAARFPTYEFVFNSVDLVNPEDKPEKVVADGSEQVVWGTVPLLVSDRGEFANIQQVQTDLRFVAERYIKEIARLHRGWTWFYSTIWKFYPNSHVSAVGYSDVGGEFTCQVAIGDDYAVDWVGNELTWNGELCRPGAPKSRSNVPYGRELYGVLIDWFPPYQASPGTTEVLEDAPRGVEEIPEDLPAGPHPIEIVESPPAIRDKVPPLPDGRAGLVVLQSGHAVRDLAGRATNVIWQARAIAVAFNGTGRPIKMGKRVYGKWNYQLMTSGAWVIVSVGAHDPEFSPDTDWQMLCLEDPEPIDRKDDPGTVTADKRRMLMLVDLEDGVGLSLWSGPACSVLYTRDDERTPIVWDTCPTLQALTVKCWLKIGEDSLGTNGPAIIDAPPPLAAAAASDTWIGKSRRGDIQVRLPPPAQRSDQFLVSGPTQGKKTELDWAGPGLTGYIEVGDYTKKAMQFDNGLLVWSSDNDAFVEGLKTQDLPPKKYGVEFDDCPCEQFNPCEEERAGTSACGVCEGDTGWAEGQKIRVRIDGWSGLVEFYPVDRVTGRDFDARRAEAVDGEYEFEQVPGSPCTFRAAFEFEYTVNDTRNLGGDLSTATGLGFILLSFRIRDDGEYDLAIGVGPGGDEGTTLVGEPFDCGSSQTWTMRLEAVAIVQPGDVGPPRRGIVDVDVTYLGVVQ